MKSGFYIVDKVFQLINIGSVSNLISGNILKHRRPLNSQNQDVVILTLTNPNNFVQNGVLIINIHAEDIGGQPDVDTLNAVGESIKTIIDDYSSTDGEYFELKISHEKIISDADQTGWSYLSYRIEFFIES